ncbi:MAG: MerR family transcriptional regulator [Peptococcaceae bacterium]|nr:MerR family transcriptional regulator [Peptococcaceae bacterium]
MRIGEISRETGVSVRSLRYYETKGLMVSRRMENRDYDHSALEKVRKIQLYFALGLGTEEIRHVLECPVLVEERQPLCERAVLLFEEKLREVEGQIQTLETISARLKERISDFRKG